MRALRSLALVGLGVLLGLPAGLALAPDAGEAPRVAPSVPQEAPVPLRAPAALAVARPDLPAPPSEGAASPPPEVWWDEVRASVRAELEAEEAARHHARREAMLDHQLDRVADFADAQGLDDATWATLEDAVLTFHDRMEALGPPEGPPGPPEAQDADDPRRAAFDALDDTVLAALGPDGAEAFRDAMRPPGGPPR